MNDLDDLNKKIHSSHYIQNNIKEIYKIMLTLKRAGVQLLNIKNNINIICGKIVCKAGFIGIKWL